MNEANEVDASGEDIVRFENVALGYGGNVVVDNVTFSIPRGDFLGIIGPNGSGKTTILRSILGDLRPRRGRITVSPGLRFGYVIQRQHLDSLFPLSTLQVVEMGRYGKLGPLRRLGKRDRRVIDESLDVVGISDLRGRIYRDLSGGQKQRVLLARALASEPDVLLLDEPTNDLDISGESRIMDLIHDIHHRRDITVIMVSHLLHVVFNHVERLMFLRGGEVTIHSIREVMEHDFLARLYGVAVRVGEIDGRRVIIME